ncbi:MAG: hypothetical protein JXR80_05230 [Deltaproteobacteria bacterium]|nr:hypothetical protein [Deltaproteobacteria bacterium]
MRSFLVFLSSLLVFCGVACDCRALTVALLPFADISSDYNGVDLAATDTFHELLEIEGLTLIDGPVVRRFMAQYRLRRAGSLDSFTARKIGRELEADLVLIVTLCESGGVEKGRFGILVTALETVGGEVVWTSQQSSSLFEETALLGIGTPRDGSELKIRLMQTAARRTAQALPELELFAAAERGPFRLVDIEISPEYTQGLSTVECFLKIEALADMPEKVELSSEGGPIVLIPGKAAGEYHGSWTAPSKDGEYPVSLTLTSKTIAAPVHLQKFARYTVINKAPQLTIELKQGITLNEVAVFRDQLLITSSLQPSRPVSRWQFMVLLPDGTVQVKDEQDGDLPRDLLWRGCNSKRQRLQDGEYSLALTIWDAAGNQTRSEKKVSLRTECQPVEVKTVKKGDKNIVRLSTPEISLNGLGLTWKLHVYSPDGAPLLEQSGSMLPAEIELPAGIDVDFLLYSIDVQDLIGNTFSLAENRLYMPDSGLQVAGVEKWSEDF